MSSTSTKIPPTALTTKRLITVARGQAPLKNSAEVRPGPQLSSILQPGTGAGRGKGGSLPDLQPTLRRPNIASLTSRSNSVLSEEDSELQRMKAELEVMKNKIECLENEKEKDLRIIKLQQELSISQKLLEIQARKTEVQVSPEPEEGVQPSVYEAAGSPAPPLGLFPPLFSAVDSTRDTPSPINYYQGRPAPQSDPQPPILAPLQLPSLDPRPDPQLPILAPLQLPTLDPRPDPHLPTLAPHLDLQLPTLAPQPKPRTEIFTFPEVPNLDAPSLTPTTQAESSLISYYSTRTEDPPIPDDRGVDIDGLVYNYSVVQEQEKILKQIEEANLKKSLDECRSYELIQQLALEESRPAPESSEWTETPTQPMGTGEDISNWKKVSKAVRPTEGKKKQERLRREQDERKEKEWEEWREKMRLGEEKERDRLLRTHAESQKLRMIKEDFNTEVLVPTAPPSSVPQPTGGSVALPLGGARTKQTTAKRLRGPTQKGQKSSEFEVGRKKAASELRQRIEAQEAEKKQKLQQERLEREWQRARERTENIAAARGKKQA